MRELIIIMAEQKIFCNIWEIIIPDDFLVRIFIGSFILWNYKHMLKKELLLHMYKLIHKQKHGRNVD